MVEDEKEIITPPAQNEDGEKNPIDEAKRVLEETNQALIKITEERKRIEKATAESLVNGRSFAGQTPKPPVEESNLEYKNRIMRGQ